MITADRITLTAASSGPSGDAHHPRGPVRLERLAAPSLEGGAERQPTDPANETTQPVAASPVDVRGVIAPRAATCCHIAMNVAMAYMLVVLL